MSRSKTLKPDWHPADIKCAMLNKGYTFARLSREMGYKNYRTPNQVLVRPWPKVESAIAEVIGVPAHRIWPSRYNRPRYRSA
jgi:Ner family transcriptional regulator